MSTQRDDTAQRTSDTDTNVSSTIFTSLMMTLLDTTWRMFVPSVGLTLLGVWADAQFGTKPWLMAAGVALGFAGAALLVRQQLVGIKRRKEAKK